VTRIAILDDYQHAARAMADWSPLRADVVAFDKNLPDVTSAAAALADFEVICIMRERMPVPAELIERLPKLKLIVATGERNRSLDIAAAERRGVVVTYAAGGDGYYATTELTLALMLACARHIPREDRAMRAGGWQTTIGTTLNGKTLGLLGLGKLGRRMAELGLALGMRPVAWSPNMTLERAADAGCAFVSREDLFATADVVSVHMVLAPSTRGLVGAADLARMKESAILINTSRGPLIDEAALIAALKAGRPGRAGLDVYDIEPLPPQHPLRALENVVLSPHLGYVSEATYRAFYTGMVECIAAWQAGKPIRLMKAG
jgi:phosphoglycerate dehydrogenase-like enzyme